MSFRPRDEAGQERVGDDDRAEQVDAIGVEVAGQRDVREAAAEHHAGVVDEDVDRSAFPVDPVPRRGDAVGIGDVHRAGGRPSPVRRESRRGGLERGGVDVGEDDVGARSGEPACDRETEPRRPAGHEHALLGQVAHDGL